MATYLLTGGAGFIGSHLCRHLLGQGATVVVVDNLSTGLRANVPAAARLLELDLTRRDFADDLPDERFDAVIHLAAQSSGDVSMDDPVHDLDVNARSTLALAHWALARGIRRFLYGSSMSVYGAVDALPIAETAQARPLSFYGASKLASELMLSIMAGRGLSPTCFRIFSCYGPGQNLGNKRQGMVSIYLAHLLEDGAVTVTGSLDRSRDLVHVDDVVDAFARALDRPATPHLTYNLGAGREITVREMLVRMTGLLGLDMAQAVTEGPGAAHDQQRVLADIARAGAALGWRPATRFEDGLAGMVAWAQDAVKRRPSAS